MRQNNNRIFVVIINTQSNLEVNQSRNSVNALPAISGKISVTEIKRMIIVVITGKTILCTSKP